MSEWKEYKLGEICKVKGGKRLPKGNNLTTVPNSHPYIRVRDMGEKYLPINNLEYVPNEIFPSIKNYIVDKGDLLLSIVGTVGLVSLVNDELDKASLTENCVKIIPQKDIIDNEFLYYFLKSNIGQEEIFRKIVGAVQPKLPIYNINDIGLNIPDLPTQTAIAEILSSLDDKMELNNKINQELENLAQTLFKRWFIDFEFPNENGEPYKSSGGEMVDSELGEIPKGWVYGNLNQIANLSKLNVKPFENPNDFYYHYSLPEFDSGKIPSRDLGATILSSKYQVLEHSILVSKLNPRIPRIWTVLNPIKNSICSTEFQVMKPIKIEYFPFVNYLCLSGEYLNSIQSKVTGTSSSHQRVNPKDIINFPLALPPDSIVNQFFKTVYEQMVMIDNNRIENIQLTNLRDTLLPKLISGELEVSQTQSIS
jgi:type I restriction enzyme S subunit